MYNVSISELVGDSSLPIESEEPEGTFVAAVELVTEDIEDGDKTSEEWELEDATLEFEVTAPFGWSENPAGPCGSFSLELEDDSIATSALDLIPIVAAAAELELSKGMILSDSLDPAVFVASATGVNAFVSSHEPPEQPIIESNAVDPTITTNLFILPPLSYFWSTEKAVNLTYKPDPCHRPPSQWL
jgi:hypothetical protein